MESEQFIIPETKLRLADGGHYTLKKMWPFKFRVMIERDRINWRVQEAFKLLRIDKFLMPFIAKYLGDKVIHLIPRNILTTISDYLTLAKVCFLAGIKRNLGSNKADSQTALCTKHILSVDVSQ